MSAADEAALWAVWAQCPANTRVRLRDGHVGTVDAVGYSRGVLCAWVTGRPATPVGEIAGRA